MPGRPPFDCTIRRNGTISNFCFRFFFLLHNSIHESLGKHCHTFLHRLSCPIVGKDDTHWEIVGSSRDGHGIDILLVQCGLDPFLFRCFMDLEHAITTRRKSRKLLPPNRIAHARHTAIIARDELARKRPPSMR